MKEGVDFHSPPPPDDPHDPLLAALRKHLGENFGQEPPAALWAGIRQQLPGAPRPWWRSRRLLPLLALLVGIVALGVFSARQNGWLGGRAATQLATSKFGESARSQKDKTSNKAKAIAAQASNEQTTREAPGAAIVSGTSVQPRTTLGSQPGSSAVAASQVSTTSASTRKNATVTISTSKQLSAAVRGPVTARRTEAAPSAEFKHHTRHLDPAVTQYARQHVGTTSQQRTNSLATQSLQKALVTAKQVSASSVAAKQSPYASATTVAASASARKRNRRRTEQPALLPARPEATDVSTDIASQPTATLSNRLALSAPSATGTDGASSYGSPVALDSLASRRTMLLLASPSLPAKLASTADSSKPWFLPARRWSVLVLAGPTLSFRTVRPANTGGLGATPPIASIPYQGFNNLSGTRTTSANVVDLERPAAGRSAQVQVRRVLTGRWALAFGAGYQEYATRLAMEVTIRRPLAMPSSPVSNVSYRDSTFSVNQRDTYQLFTLPLQLSYALGPPRGRLFVSLLGGLEPSWYVGGRTTEGSNCNCEQQSFSSASGSPYNAFSLGLSLGLDARYRLGGPASRWQWVLQPTGRYVASSFVRSNTLYARRQPYSLGLLTGLAWEF